VVVVGAGFIGLELVENLVRRQARATILEHNGQVLPPLDREMTTPLHRELQKHGVTVRLQDSAAGFTQKDGRLAVQLKSGGELPADLVILGIGVRPENALAVQAGLQIGPRGGIRVNAMMQTSDPDIYAVGDVVETTDFQTGEPTQVPLAGPANRQGRLAADDIFGRDVGYRGTQGTAILRVFDLTAAITGHSEKVLQRANRPYRKIYIHPAQHAGYYPGAQPMTLKLLFDPESGVILGAQGVGGEGVDKRIDVLAIAIQAGMTVFDLEQAELAYSPQYGSAKDPINMLGFVASEVLHGEHDQITVEELQTALASPEVPVLLDVRTPDEFAAGHIPGARNLPVDELRGALGTLPKNRTVVTYCQVGQRGYLAQRILKQSGWLVRNLSGGYKTYELYGLPVDR
jgi:rhodanese-related sulfurtransferase